jgi:hypothetical protein
MPRIICRYDVCIFNKDSSCTAKEMEYDPDQGCLTAQDRDEFDGVIDDEEEFDEDELKPDEDEDSGDDELDDDDDEDLFSALDEDAEEEEDF